MIQVYKIVTGIDKIDPNSIFEFRKKSQTRGNKKKLFKRRSRLNVRKGSFSQRTANDWNSLPQAVIESESLDQFKNRLDRHWLGERYIPGASATVFYYCIAPVHPVLQGITRVDVSVADHRGLDCFTSHVGEPVGV